MLEPIDKPVIVAPNPTPFKADDSVDYSAIERNVDRWIKTSLSGFVLNSENGEEGFLSESERFEIIRTVNRARNGQKVIIGGIDSPSVSESIRIAEELVKAGADILRIRVPRLTQNISKYFEDVVPHVPAPVMIIAQPSPGSFGTENTSISGLQAELLGELTHMENVSGYIAGGEVRFAARVRQFCDPKKYFWLGNGLLALSLSVVGANGACCMFGNIAPTECREIISSVAKGDLQTAQEIQFKCIEADYQILSRGAAGIKTALDLLGYEGGNPRAPQSPCTLEEKNLIKHSMERAGLI